MSRREWVVRAVELLAAVVVLSLVLGQALGTPVGLSYVETGSMEPTLGPSDVVLFCAEGDSGRRSHPPPRR